MNTRHVRRALTPALAAMLRKADDSGQPCLCINPGWWETWCERILWGVMNRSWPLAGKVSTAELPIANLKPQPFHGGWN